MEEQSMQYMIELAKKKKKLLDHEPIKYMIRAILAGLYISFALIMCVKLGQDFHEYDSPATYLMTSIFFAVALVIIIYGGAELFTGNTMYFTISTFHRETTVVDTLRNWVACYSGNLIGAILFALMFFATDIFKNISEDHMLFIIANKKISATTSALFFKGILCNIMVCLACFLPTRVKSDGAKITLIFLSVFTFFISGYEHSIANLAVFSLSLGLDHPDSITLLGALHNLIPVTLGNIVGGSIFVGLAYAYLNTPEKEKKNRQKKVA